MLKPGVYLLYRRGKVVYIGRSKCLLLDVAEHRNLAYKRRVPEWVTIKGIQFDEVSVIPCDLPRATLLRDALIDHFQPTHNIHDGPAIRLPPEILAKIERRV